MKKTFFIFGFEKWGGLRPAYGWKPDGRCYRPLFFGLWLRWPWKDYDPGKLQFTPQCRCHLVTPFLFPKDYEFKLNQEFIDRFEDLNNKMLQYYKLEVGNNE